MDIRKIAVAGFLTLTGCPYDEFAANATPGDGGLWLGDPADGGTFIPQNADASGVVYLTKAPAQKTLCKLIIGDYAPIMDMNAPRFLGTWIGDVEAPYFFGPPAPNSEQLGIDSATVSYHWPNGGIILSFKWVQAWDRSAPQEHWASAPWPKAFFLQDIAMEGDPQFQDCWRQQLGYKPEPCPECQGSNDKIWECNPYPCDSKDIREGK